ncbi:hypothetical protein [Colwellia sp. MB02u-9]|uniref:hypothetical protein n=1 Tax=Colwellia sp. MB02u-9 TaxID=2759823 RepID=UPI0015F45D3A|nr:hypothetical protein [Colwellia sp. MB02u-9]MBA6294828.1 hypothetical protein [Colwellia sp. MB02u-9]
MSVLSPNTEFLIHTLFKSSEATDIVTILEDECGIEALDCEGWTPIEMERIRFAVLKLSTDSKTNLEKAIKLANSDWRDLLMAAGFGDDLDSHKKWFESVAN